MRDDRLLAPTRWTGVGIVPVLTAAFVVLYGFPGKTRELWAWTITPTMTPMLMGAGYLAGGYFFFRVARETHWHRIGIGILAVVMFTTLLGLETFIHWDRFNHDHVSFWAWLSLYVVTPVLLPWLWFNNRRTDPGVPEEHDLVVPRLIRIPMGITGAVVLLIALTMFLWPSLYTGRWPWMLTPLTARTIAAFLSFPAVTWIGALFDSRWSSMRIPLETSTIGLALIGVGVIRAWDEFDGGVATWLYVGSMVTTLLYLGGLIVWGRRSAPRPAPAPAA